MFSCMFSLNFCLSRIEKTHNVGFIDNWETCLEKSAKDGIRPTLDGAAVVSSCRRVA